MTLRPIALNDLPYPSQVRLESGDGHWKVQTDSSGRAGFPDVPTSMTAGNLFIEAAGQDNVAVPGYAWYGAVVAFPPNPQNDWWATPIPDAYPRPLSPTWYQLPVLLVPSVAPVVQRPPLPPFPAGTYDRSLPWECPETRDFLRADAWGVTIFGLPFVPKGSSEHPERLLTYFLYKYLYAQQEAALRQYASYGYTHFCISWPDARDDGHFTVAQFVEHALFIKEFVPYVVVFLGSKDFDPRDQTPAQWAARVDPVMDALIAANAVDEFVPAWEMDAFNIPGRPTIDYCKHVGQKAHAAGKSCWLHFLPEHTSWFKDGDPRGRYGFYDDVGTDVDGLMYQTKPEWTVPELQARLVDTLTQFANQGHRHKLRMYEDAASLMFTHDRPNEDDANLRGYLACCTAAAAPLWGYGNGARLPDGRVL